MFVPSNQTWSPSLYCHWGHLVVCFHDSSVCFQASYTSCHASVICSRHVLTWGIDDVDTSHVAHRLYPIRERNRDVHVVSLYHKLCVNSATGR